MQDPLKRILSPSQSQRPFWAERPPGQVIQLVAAGPEHSAHFVLHFTHSPLVLSKNSNLLQEQIPEVGSTSLSQVVH